MKTLQNIYDNKINFPTFFERKIRINSNKTILYGAKSSGKTFLIYDYLSQYEDKNYIYIDENDFRFTKFSTIDLEEFIESNNIQILVIENYSNTIVLPKVDSIILSTKNNFNLDGFDIVEVLPLDFEEYILFDTKHQNTTNSFNSFLKYGNLPEIIEYREFKKQHRNQELLSLYENNQTSLEILKLLIKSSGETKSPFWLYGILKKEIKISKDFFYNKIKQYEQNSIIFLCQKYNQPKAVKKIFCFNHALIDVVLYEKKFANIFANMIFLELYTKFDDIYYMDGVDFYIPSQGSLIISMPFFNKNLFSNISNKLLKSIDGLEINTITIVTISNYDTMHLNEIVCDIMPFYEWAFTN